MVQFQLYVPPPPPNPPQPEVWYIDPEEYPDSDPFVLDPRNFHGRTEPVFIMFLPRHYRLKSYLLDALFLVLASCLAVFLAGLTYEMSKAFIFGTTTPAPQVVLAPTAPTNLFAFDAGLLAQSMTPARLTESQATALSRVLSPPPVVAPDAPTVEEDDSADSCATDLCQILEAAKPVLSVASKAARPYLLLTSKVFGLGFLESYLLGEPQEKEDDKNDDASSQSIDYFDWAIDIDQAVLHGTTPAALPLVDEEKATAFYEMTLGHEYKGKKYVSAVEAALNDLFVWDSDLLEQSVTPARLTKVQGRGLSGLRAPAENKCCPMDVLCRLLAVAPKYIPGLLELLGYDDYNSNKRAPNFAWITTVWDQAIYRDTMPAFLPSGRTNEESGISFYELTEKLSRNPEPDAASTDFWRPKPGFQRRVKIVNESGSSFEVHWWAIESTRETALHPLLDRDPSAVQGAEVMVDSSVGYEHEIRETAGPNGECKDKVCRHTFFTVSENDEQVVRVTADFETIIVDSKIRAEMQAAATCPGTHSFFAFVRRTRSFFAHVRQKTRAFGQKLRASNPKTFDVLGRFLPREVTHPFWRWYLFFVVLLCAWIDCDEANDRADAMPGMVWHIDD